MMYVHRYDRTFTGRIAIWERPIAYFMSEHVCTISENQCLSLACFLLPEFLWWLLVAHIVVYISWNSSVDMIK